MACAWDGSAGAPAFKAAPGSAAANILAQRPEASTRSSAVAGPRDFSLKAVTDRPWNIVVGSGALIESMSGMAHAPSATAATDTTAIAAILTPRPRTHPPRTAPDTDNASHSRRRQSGHERAALHRRR